ncbi:MAG: hypothetical protein HC837_11745 [Chloroflexaceae bacterium]|nr:hypothetical protein [Chloroflexaceae bacterium]
MPISGLQTEVIEGTPVQVQWFERVRLELHPQQDVPYDVLVSRLGVDLLMNQGRDWWLFPQSEPATDCLFFEQTSKNLCSPFLEAWRERGLELDGQPGFSDNESLALLGMPISDAQLERLSDGAQYQVQWFERGRLELHPQQPAPFTVQSGLLGREMEIYRTNERLQPLRRDD